MNKIEEAYYKAMKSGVLEELVPDYTGDFELDRTAFKKAWIQKKSKDPKFRLL